MERGVVGAEEEESLGGAAMHGGPDGGVDGVQDQVAHESAARFVVGACEGAGVGESKETPDEFRRGVLRVRADPNWQLFFSAQLENLTVELETE